MPNMIAIGTATIAEGRTTGQRTANAQMLRRAADWLGSIHQGEGVMAIERWLNDNPERAPGKGDLVQAKIELKELAEVQAAAGNAREAAYAELAGYCVTACLAEKQA